MQLIRDLAQPAPKTAVVNTSSRNGFQRLTDTLYSHDHFPDSTSLNLRVTKIETEGQDQSESGLKLWARVDGVSFPYAGPPLGYITDEYAHSLISFT